MARREKKLRGHARTKTVMSTKNVLVIKVDPFSSHNGWRIHLRLC
jgi:hypothetical protein